VTKTRFPEIVTNASEADAIVCRLESECPPHERVAPTSLGTCFRCGAAIVFHNIKGRAAMKKICLPCIHEVFKNGLN
jgi:hypothetical protein